MTCVMPYQPTAAANKGEEPYQGLGVETMSGPTLSPEISLCFWCAPLQSGKVSDSLVAGGEWDDR